MMQSEKIGELAAALAKARKAIKAIGKGRKAEIATKAGGKYSYSYADLADVLEAITGPLADNGLALIQTTQTDPAFGLVTTLAHSSGEFISGVMPLPGEDGDARSLGSWLTYLRRYAACAIVGVAAEDDDDAEGARPKAPRQIATATEFKETRDEIARVASELEQYVGKQAEEIIKAASGFPGKKGETVFFTDPHDPSLRSEKWLKGTLAKLLAELSKLEPGAAEGAEMLK